MTLARAEKTRLPRRLPHPAAAPRRVAARASLADAFARRGPSVPLDARRTRSGPRAWGADALEAMIRAGRFIKTPRTRRASTRSAAHGGGDERRQGACRRLLSLARTPRRRGARAHRAGPGAGVRARRRRGPTRTDGNALRRPERSGTSGRRVSARRVSVAEPSAPPAPTPEFRTGEPPPLDGLDRRGIVVSASPLAPASETPVVRRGTEGSGDGKTHARNEGPLLSPE